MFGEIIESIEWIMKVVVGWRYVFSSTFRNEVHRQWKGERWFVVAVDIAGGISGVILSISIAVGIVWFIRHVVK